MARRRHDMRQRLSAVGLESFCETTFKGLHVVASLLYGASDNV
ncbi:hypothetical protein ACFIOY_24080 [Bradyrhizobium sp. TZ2]